LFRSQLAIFFLSFFWGSFYIPPITNKSILPRHRLGRDDALAPRHEPPPSRSERPVQDAPVLDLGQVDDAVGLDLDVLGVRRRQQDVRHLLGERLHREPVVGARPVDLLLGADVELERAVGEARLLDVVGRGVVGRGRDDGGGAGGHGIRSWWRGWVRV